MVPYSWMKGGDADVWRDSYLDSKYDRSVCFVGIRSALPALAVTRG